MKNAKELPIIETRHLFSLLDAKLLQLLQDLSPEDWARPALPKWTVKDIAAHLLDSNVRRVSIGRDGFYGVPFQGSSPQELIAFLNGLNHTWVEACRRLSPRVLTDLLRTTGRQLSLYMESLEPLKPAALGVSWAGEEKSLNWFDVAREYTEKWHHQQQIREAVGREGIMTRELYAPVIATFMRVLPYAYRDVDAGRGTNILFRVAGDCGGEWTLERTGSGWRLLQGSNSDVLAEVVIPGELAWKLFTKGLTGDSARARISAKGDRTLTDPIFAATAIVG